jgi:hypothetical protein
MRWIIGSAITLCLVAVCMLLKSKALLVLGDSAQPFWGNFLLNLSTELLGFSITALLGVFVAKMIARGTFKELSEPVIELIKELRIGETINSKAARQCVKITVRLLSDEQIRPALKSLHIKSKDEPCGVCALDSDVDGDKCRFCGLNKKLWGDSLPLNN